MFLKSLGIDMKLGMHLILSIILTNGNTDDGTLLCSYFYFVFFLLKEKYF